MTIINTTFITSTTTEGDVLGWIRSAYIKCARQPDRSPYPHMIALIENSPQADATAYAVHITFPDDDAARSWDDKFGSRLRGIAQQRWGEKALSFVTYLRVIE